MAPPRRSYRSRRSPDSRRGQLDFRAAKLQLKASEVGQVFAIALDDGRDGPVPNIYLGATSAYGLQIVCRTPMATAGRSAPRPAHPARLDGRTVRPHRGGGPGSIWKVDGQTGAVSLFATLPGNSGPGVGDIVFDRLTRNFSSPTSIAA